MKNKLKIIKKCVWALMLICIVLDIIPIDSIGIIPHIIAGCVFAVLSLLHIFLSRKYFFACLKSFFTKNLKTKVRINIIIDLLLIILLIVITITGIQASPSSLNGSVNESLASMHGAVGAVMIILAVVHGCLHIKIKRKKNAA